jgi:hypothetical protein
LAPFGAHFGHFVGICEKWNNFSAELASILAPFWDPNP